MRCYICGEIISRLRGAFIPSGIKVICGKHSKESSQSEDSQAIEKLRRLQRVKRVGRPRKLA